VTVRSDRLAKNVLAAGAGTVGIYTAPAGTRVIIKGCTLFSTGAATLYLIHAGSFTGPAVHIAGGPLTAGVVTVVGDLWEVLRAGETIQAVADPAFATEITVSGAVLVL